MAIDLAVIGGTGLYRLAALSGVQAVEGDTPYGAPSGPVRVGELAGRRVAFLARHGEGHSLPPHRVNYRANLWRLKDLGARRVLAVNTVGGITEAWGPQVLGLPDQLIDYTWGRTSSFWDGEGGEVLHVDFGDPYTPSLRAAVLAAAATAGVAVVDGGCYGATQGPRLETKAEIARMRRDGGPEAWANARVEAFATAHPDWCLRQYRTPAGFRLLVMHRPFDPSEPEVEACFNALKTDPLYALMCVRQHCFRARVTAV